MFGSRKAKKAIYAAHEKFAKSAAKAQQERLKMMLQRERMNYGVCLDKNCEAF